MRDEFYDMRKIDALVEQYNLRYPLWKQGTEMWKAWADRVLNLENVKARPDLSDYIQDIVAYSGHGCTSTRSGVGNTAHRRRSEEEA